MSLAYDLVIDTSRKGIALGLYAEQAGAWESHAPAARGELLDGMLLALLDEVGAELSQVRRVLVTVGPGSFTGLRTGIAYAEGLCVGKRRSLHGVSTLRALATLASPATSGLAWPDNTVVLYKARPGYWYIGCTEGEFFDDTACALEHLRKAQRQVVDEAAFMEPAFQEFLSPCCSVDKGDNIASFVSLLPFLPAQTGLKANYIQDSYFEKKA